MAELEIRNVSRRFPSGGGLRSVSLSIEQGEFFVLLGPSGCGKSTLLRLIAGLDPPDSGEIAIAGRGGDSAGSRGAVAMVFQNYALYPHMTAFDNIAFPLKIMRLGADEIARRVAASAQLAGLSIELRRRPGELSGGERQRVALARALVREPKVILMDEPLSNLDAQLRASLRVELKEFQRRTGRTFVYVTHDQLEAVTLADRLAVMRDGGIEQVGTPADVYGRPSNEFVAGFVGQPPMNLIRIVVSPDGSALLAGETRLPIAPPSAPGTEITLGIRPVDLHMEPGEGYVEVEVTIERVEFIGPRFLASAVLGDSRLIVELAQPLEPGQTCRLYVRQALLHFFDRKSGNRLQPDFAPRNAGRS